MKLPEKVWKEKEKAWERVPGTWDQVVTWGREAESRRGGVNCDDGKEGDLIEVVFPNFESARVGECTSRQWSLERVRRYEETGDWEERSVL